MASMLFVCSGNIFRSVVAEYALKAVLGADTAHAIGSAGIEATTQPMHPLIRQRLLQKGADPSRHVPRRLTPSLVAEVDVLVAMGLNHHAHIRRCFGREPLLFNQVCLGREESVLDIHEAVPDWAARQDEAIAYAARTIDHIWESIPAFLRYLDQPAGPETGRPPRSVQRT